MFGEVLHNILYKSRTMTPDDVGGAWGLEARSIYYYMDKWPGLDKFLFLLRIAPLDAQRELMALVGRYAPGWIMHPATVRLDINGDGQIDLDDLLACSVAKVSQASRALAATHDALGDARLTADEADDLERSAQEGLEAMVAYMHILTHMRQHKMLAVRKAAKIGGAS